MVKIYWPQITLLLLRILTLITLHMHIAPSSLDSQSAEILHDLTFVQLNGIGISDLHKLQTSDTSLVDLRQFAKDTEKKL